MRFRAGFPNFDEIRLMRASETLPVKGGRVELSTDFLHSLVSEANHGELTLTILLSVHDRNVYRITRCMTHL